MRIAVIGQRGFPHVQGGVESHCENIMTRLCREHLITVYRRRPYIDRMDNAALPDIRFIDLPSTRVKGFEALWHTFLSVMHIILHHNVDAVNVHNIGPGLFVPVLKLFGYKVVLTYHSPNYEHSKWGGFARLLLRTGEALSLRYADRVIFVNKVQMDKYTERVRRRSVYIPNGINRVTPSAGVDCLVSRGIPQSGYVLAVGRLTPEKGFDTLVRAVNSLGDGVTAVIAGGADHNPGYLDYLKSLDVNNRVIFAGFATGEALRQLYSHAALFVLPSVNEGFPIALLEAMSYGLPAVVSDIPGTRAVPLDADCYVKPGDVASLADAIVHGLDAAAAGSGRKSYPGLEEYDWDNIAALTNKVYKEL